MRNDDKSFIDKSWVNAKSTQRFSFLESPRVSPCFVCRKDSIEPVYEVCDCDYKVHLDCFLSQCKKVTKYKIKAMTIKISVDDFFCSFCQRNYNSKVISFRKNTEWCKMLYQPSYP